MNRLLAHLQPLPEIENPEANVSSSAMPNTVDRQRIAELTIAELMITIESQRATIKSQRAELANAYQEIVNKERLLEDLEASYGRESTSPQGENEDGERI